MQIQLSTFLTLALDRGEWVASHPGCFIPRKRTIGTHWIGGWVGPRASLDMVSKRKKIPSLPLPEIKPQLSKCYVSVQYLVTLIFNWLVTISTSRGLRSDVCTYFPTIVHSTDIQ
jgi:hypothetical protein